MAAGVIADVINSAWCVRKYLIQLEISVLLENGDSDNS